MKINFFKYQGAGNDFVIVDNRLNNLSFSSNQINEICDRKYGVGGDGFILLNNHNKFDFEMKYFNSNGEISSMCGNGARCVVHLAYSLKIMFNMVPIGISSTITCSAAIVKFKKYQEKMEYMQFTREKVILAISKLKLVQESLWFNKDEDFDEIKQKYLHDVYLIYNESNSELERHIKYDDHTKFFEMNQKKRKEKKEKKNELLSIV